MDIELHQILEEERAKDAEVLKWCLWADGKDAAPLCECGFCDRRGMCGAESAMRRAMQRAATRYQAAQRAAE